jgi:predicted RNase H-like HicB family nuclease
MLGFMKLSIELDREDDGRWIAEALELPGVMTYGATREEAISNTERLAIEVIADQAWGIACFGSKRVV